MIASVRDALRLSQRSLARRAGVNHRTVSRIERGQRPSPHTLQCIAGALGVEIEDLCPQWGKVMFSRQHGVALLGLGAEEVEQLNAITQVYARDFLFYRDDKPELSEAFQHGEHRQFQYHGHHWLDPLLDDLSQYNHWGKDGAAGISSRRPYSESLKSNRWLDGFVPRRD
ncbi:XRE family transcriptional regulator [Sphingomonas koreensis]|nr:XRE family transcriptional regulator [Sphingomonas koreensis]